MIPHIKFFFRPIISICLGLVVNHYLSEVRDSFRKAQAVANQTAFSEPQTPNTNEKKTHEISIANRSR